MPDRDRAPFRLGVVTDEISDELPHALRVAGELGCEAVELNGVGGRNLTDWEADQAGSIRDQVERSGLAVAVVATPCFKTCLLDGVSRGRVAEEGTVRDHLARLERGCRWARQLGAPYVRIFSFRRSGMAGLGNPSPRPPGGGAIADEMLEKIVEGLRPAARLAERWEVTLAIENVRSCWGNAGVNTAGVLAALDSPRVRAIWDPANAYVSGESNLEEGYRALRPWTVHVHAKDARVLEGATGLTAWEAMREGEVDWEGQMRALRADGFAGVVCLETHWRPENATPEEATRRSMQGLRRLTAAHR